MTDDILLSTDRSRLDIARVHAWLADSYWSPGIARPLVVRAIAGSQPVGAYRADGEQVGFARLITDGATFAWLADVFVEASVRGQGIGRRMIAMLIDDPDMAGIRRVMLNTRDAHDVYAPLGFAAPVRPDFLMERLQPGAAALLRAL